MNKMIVPRRNRSPFAYMMADPFDMFFGMPAPKPRHMVPQRMRSDIKKTDEGYELTIELPGFSKEDVQAELKDGYLAVSAETKSESEDKDEKGAYVRKERFTGKCRRAFYVGEDVDEADIKAKFENGVLTFNIPNKQEEQKPEEKRSIAIE